MVFEKLKTCAFHPYLWNESSKYRRSRLYIYETKEASFKLRSDQSKGEKLEIQIYN